MLSHINLIGLLVTPILFYIGSATVVICLEHFKLITSGQS
ncbi:hypothetical protein GPAL_2395 [Glaciecola pallidula DSM 14239 = ACAM 615]|jgi:hypothetical protein|uniref:Uncharacterized protein n=1 Tax=Brumicola pallidula DSM 14239 = ACAM 615 TaxID=1121922 RepID=K6YZ71_9ALTE|nr:hypothetical protein GPAL_2395 [Glaciecola pallidula DSM 14239 = ACAM 615]